jgi:hypothetical protein
MQLVRKLVWSTKEIGITRPGRCWMRGCERAVNKGDQVLYQRLRKEGYVTDLIEYIAN